MTLTNDDLLAISQLFNKRFDTIESSINEIKEDITAVKEDITALKDDLETVKRDVKHLKKEAIKAQAMDEAILNEVERVHDILNKHTSNSTVHTA